MPTEDLLGALLAFALGLLAKFLYDIWTDSRKQKSLLFVKTVLSSFRLSDLDDDIRKEMQVSYGHRNIQSVHRVRVEVENNGAAVVNNQAFTVRFSENASIISPPQSQSSSEDLREVQVDEQAKQPNSYRFLLLYFLVKA
ncbi:hypothetical protein KFU94_39730 [Chloroflexi bacterium TSY]|nr:hypothetical protein [Chloroflexi bacterium TSY]